MTNLTTPNASALLSAKLISSTRITPEESPEEVRHLVFRTADLGFDAKIGQSIRVMAPGEYGNKHHTRLYTIADPELQQADSTEFTLCVRRCFYIDEFSGEEYQGVASNYLCDLTPGQAIQFDGPVGLVFPVPANKKADLLMIGMGTGIAPFRAYIRHLYENLGGWEGKVRLFYGARTGLEMLYMNEENKDLALYFDQKTFKAIQAVSPRPAMKAPVAIDQAIEQNAAEVLGMIQGSDTHVFIAGAEAMLATVEKALSQVAGSEEAWQQIKTGLVAGGRWNEVLY